MKKYDSYKDSGIEWIGEIPISWNVKKLKFIGNAIGGLTYSPNDVVEDESNGVLVLRSSNIQKGKLSLEDNVYVNLEISEKQTLRKGDILICSRNGSQHLIGKNICIDERTEGNTFGAFMMIFRSDNYHFLNHFFNSPIFTSQSGLFLTATINQLTSSTLNNFYLALPSSIEEQTIIANYLDHKTTQIDHLIAKKEQFIQLLEEERVAVINQAVTKGLDPSVSMKDSGIEWLGEIPEHWEVNILKHILSTTKGFAFKSDQFIDKGVPIVKASDIKNKSIRLETTHCISEENAMEFNSVKLSAGDILISTVGSTPDVINSAVGQIGKVPIELDGALLNQNTVRLEVSDKKRIFSEYLFFLIQNENYRIHLNLNAHGTANQASLKLVDLLSYKVALPPLNEQLTIVKHSKEEDQRIQNIITKTQQEIELLKEYKTALISEVVTGKVDVRN